MVSLGCCAVRLAALLSCSRLIRERRGLQHIQTHTQAWCRPTSSSHPAAGVSAAVTVIVTMLCRCSITLYYLEGSHRLTVSAAAAASVGCPETKQLSQPSGQPIRSPSQRAAPLANDNDDAIERPTSRPIPGLRRTLSCTKISHLAEPNQALVRTWRWWLRLQAVLQARPWPGQHRSVSASVSWPVARDPQNREVCF